MAINLTKSDIDWLQKKYPQLIVDTFNNKIYGQISFRLDYEGYKIEDTYSIKVDLNTLDIANLPKVYETSGKIYKVAKKYNVPNDDLHINRDGSFCIMIKGEAKQIFDNDFIIQEFFYNGIEKFLYQISFYDKEGYFPWGEYAHGYLGYLELFYEDKITLEDLISNLDKFELINICLVNRQSKCLCESNKKLRKCHPNVFGGIQKFKRYIKI